MGRKGTGTIEQVGPKHFRGYFRTTVDGKEFKTKSVFGRNRTEAHKLLDEWKKTNDLSSFSAGTVGAFLSKWFNERNWAITTRETNKYRFDKHINSNIAFNKLLLRNVKRPHIMDFMSKVDGSDNTKKDVFKLLNAAFTNALEDSLISQNPCTLVSKRDRPKKNETISECFAEDDEAKLYQYVLSKKCEPLWRAVVLLGFDIGAEPQEFLAIQRQDLNELKKEVHLQRVLIVSNAGLEVKGTMKAPCRNRTPIMNLHSWRAVNALLGPENGPESWVLSPDGQPWHYDRFLAGWKRLLKAAGVRYYKPLAMRHSMATNLLAAGHAVADVSLRLGHKKISTTYDNYVHAIPNNRAKLATSSGKRLDTLVGTLESAVAR